MQTFTRKICSLFVLAILVSFTACQTTHVKTHVTSEDPIVNRFSQLATASVSDAVDQVVGERGFMSHEIKPLFPVKMCGRAVTVRAEPSNEKQPPSMALEVIDTSPPDRVLVLAFDGEQSVDIGAFGGIMGTGSKAQNFAGAVMNAGCRDFLEIKDMGFPVFSTGLVPSSSVGRYINVAKNEPVNCGGVTVHPGDILVGDPDGVVVVPQEHEMAVLEKAEELEAKEAITTEGVIRLKSIRKAIEETDRI